MYNNCIELVYSRNCDASVRNEFEDNFPSFPVVDNLLNCLYVPVELTSSIRNTCSTMLVFRL